MTRDGAGNLLAAKIGTTSSELITDPHSDVVATFTSGNTTLTSSGRSLTFAAIFFGVVLASFQLRKMRHQTLGGSEHQQWQMLTSQFTAA